MQGFEFNIEKLNSMEFNFSYDGTDGLNNGFKISLIDAESLILVIVKPIGKINPRNKAKEVYNKLISLLTNFKLENKQRKIFLDLLSIIGMNNSYMFKWNFEEKNSTIVETILDINQQLLSETEHYAINNYFNNQLNTFTNSRLNAKQKIEVMAYCLTEDYCDDIVQENWIKYFRMILNKLRRRKSS